MNLNGNKKIIILGIILLILAGIVVVALKGFNVDLMLEQHESVNIVIGKEVDSQEITAICKEVFQNKKFVVKTLEVFNDSININVVSITDEEKESLVTKINEKYGTELTADDLTVNTNSNIRIRDIIKPYVKPVCISTILIAVYLIIRFRKQNSFKILGNILGIIVITEAILASIIAIIRIPLSTVLVNLMSVVAVVELLIYINKQEKEYTKISETNK